MGSILADIESNFEPVTEDILIKERLFTRSAFDNVVFDNMTVKTIIGATNQPKVIIPVQYYLAWYVDTQTLIVLPQMGGDYFRRHFNVCFERIELHKPTLA